MSIKVTFEFETIEAAQDFLATQPGTAATGTDKPARGRAKKDTQAPSPAAPSPAAPAAAPAAAASAAPDAPTPAPTPSSGSQVPFKDVADVITELAEADHDAAVRILGSFGVKKASELKPGQFAAVVEAAKKALSPTQAAPSLI